MIGHIYIKGQIGSFEGVKGIELIDLITQVQRQKAAEAFFVYVDSPGGSIDVGDDMYTYLKSLPQRITTVGIGMVASIATKPMLAGDERIMIQGQSDLMIHNPWADNVRGDAEDLMSAAERIRAEEDKLIDFYSEATGISREGLDALMKSETYLTPEKALELGFITKVIAASEMVALGMVLPTAQIQEAKLKALAFKTTDTMTKKIEEKIDLLINGMAKLFKGEEKKLAMVVSDSNGVSLDIKKADGTEIDKPAEGDIVSANGTPAEGSYILPDMGITIVVKAGVITSITDAAAETTEETTTETPEEAAKKELATAQAKIKELETIVEENKKSSEVIETKVALMEKSFKAIASKYQPEGRTTDFREDGKEKVVALTKDTLKERKESYKTKKK
jgi:ATP-dependent Clp protease protease subunit